MLIISSLGILVFLILNVRKQKLFRAHLFSNTVKLMLFISHVQYYVPVKLCRTVGSIHLFKITGNLFLEHVRLNKHLLWDITEIDWKEFNMTLNGNKIKFPTSVIIPLRDKFKAQRIEKWEPLLCHIMLKQWIINKRFFRSSLMISSYTSRIKWLVNLQHNVTWFTDSLNVVSWRTPLMWTLMSAHWMVSIHSR